MPSIKESISNLVETYQRGRWSGDARGSEVRIAHNTLDQLFSLFYLQSKATAASPLPNTGKSRSQRTLANRVDRAEILNQLKQVSSAEEKKQLLRKAHLLDEFDRQFSRQEAWTVELDEKGKLSAKGAEIDLTKHKDWIGPKSDQYSPIFVIPALSGDLYGLESLLRSMAFQGRRIISVAYPESFQGQLTDKFMETVLNHQAFESHADFFTAMIEQRLGQEQSFELWSYSTGGPISAQILQNESWQNRVNRAVLLSPASLVDQTFTQFLKGILLDVKDYLSKPCKLEDTGAVWLGGPDDQKNIHRTPVMKHMVGQVCRKFPKFSAMRVQLNGQIVVITGKDDHITQGIRAKEAFKDNPQVQTEILPGGHLLPLLESDQLAKRLLPVKPNVPEIDFPAII